jgi:hypothetical protein
MAAKKTPKQGTQSDEGLDGGFLKKTLYFLQTGGGCGLCGVFCVFGNTVRGVVLSIGYNPSPLQKLPFVGYFNL